MTGPTATGSAAAGIHTTRADRFEVRDVHLDDPRVQPLLAGLAAVYAERYGAVDEMAKATPAQFEPPDGAFVVLLDDGTPVAGGGLRRLDEQACEIKRVWTSPDHQRRGLASRVVRALEERAVRLGYRVARLETGPRQPEAVALYTRLGYRRVPVFGDYPQALAFERALDGPGPSSGRAR